MIYDDQHKRWVPSGPSQSQGLSKVQIYHHQINKSYRVVGWKLQDKEVCRICLIYYPKVKKIIIFIINQFFSTGIYLFYIVFNVVNQFVILFKYSENCLLNKIFKYLYICK